MKTIFFVLTLLFLQVNLRAQAYIPTVVEGKVWEIKYGVGMGGYKWYYKRIECDTTINLMQYNNVYLCNHLGNAYCKLGSIREDTTNHKVYFVDTGSSIEKMILNYDLMPGDTFNGFTVDTVFYAFQMGQFRKLIVTTAFPFVWVEGIGSSMYGIYDLIHGYSEVMAVTQYNSNCMPLSIENSSLKQHTEIKYSANTIFVNTVNSENKHIEIFNSLGQLLYKARFQKSTEVDISNFSKQMLIVHVYDMKEHFTQKIIPQ